MGLGVAALDELRAVAQHSRAGNGRFFGDVMGSGEPVGRVEKVWVLTLAYRYLKARLLGSREVLVVLP